MHSALFVAQILPSKNDWGTFLDQSQRKIDTRKCKGALRLAENVWLLNFQESPEPLSLLVAAAAACGVTYGILPIEQPPAWLPAGFDPKTIQAQSANS